MQSPAEKKPNQQKKMYAYICIFQCVYVINKWNSNRNYATHIHSLLIYINSFTKKMSTKFAEEFQFLRLTLFFVDFCSAGCVVVAFFCALLLSVVWSLCVCLLFLSSAFDLNYVHTMWMDSGFQVVDSLANLVLLTIFSD